MIFVQFRSKIIRFLYYVHSFLIKLYLLLSLNLEIVLSVTSTRVGFDPLLLLSKSFLIEILLLLFHLISIRIQLGRPFRSDVTSWNEQKLLYPLLHPAPNNTFHIFVFPLNKIVSTFGLEFPPPPRNKISSSHRGVKPIFHASFIHTFASCKNQIPIRLVFVLNASFHASFFLFDDSFLLLRVLRENINCPFFRKIISKTILWNDFQIWRFVTH